MSFPTPECRARLISKGWLFICFCATKSRGPCGLVVGALIISRAQKKRPGTSSVLFLAVLRTSRHPQSASMHPKNQQFLLRWNKHSLLFPFLLERSIAMFGYRRKWLNTNSSKHINGYRQTRLIRVFSNPCTSHYITQQAPWFSLLKTETKQFCGQIGNLVSAQEQYPYWKWKWKRVDPHFGLNSPVLESSKR